jgi:hypothetical protein
MVSRWAVSFVTAAIAAVLVPGCGASGSTTLGGGYYANGDAGEDAATSAAPAIPTPEAGPAVCGDGACSGTETCETCSLDCGLCPACSLAPSCSEAVGLPVNPTPRWDLYVGESIDAGPDASVPSALPGADGCQDAQLSLRIAQVTAHSGGGEIYCIISSTDGIWSDAALTGRTKDLGSGESYSFDPTSSIFWGGTGVGDGGSGATAFHATSDNLTITYNCFKVVDNSAWAAALNALSSAAAGAGGIAGPYGWAFGAGSAAAAAAAAAVNAASGDDLKLNGQQTIAKSELLDLTNGRTWSVRQSGGSLLTAWDWELQIESWGCAAGAVPSK